MIFDNNKFTIASEEENEITRRVDAIMSTFPANIAEHLITDMKIELTGLYILTVCNDYLKSLPSGVGGEVTVNNTSFAIIIIEKDILISSI